MRAELDVRSGGQCELSGVACDELAVVLVSGGDDSVDAHILVCAAHQAAIDDASLMVANEWRFLNEAIWSTVPAVQVVAYRALHQLASQGETWAQDALDSAYLEEEVMAWAQKGIASDDDDDGVVQKDSNGMVLAEGDSVTLIKDLDVKGTGFTAKRGTLVKNIHLTNDAKFIEGKINGATIVIVAAFTKKA